MLSAQHSSDGGVARAEAFGGGDYVRDDRETFSRKPVTSASNAGHDLVKADQEAMAIAALGQPFPEVRRRAVRGQGRGCDGFAKVRGHRFRPSLFEHLVESLQCLLAGGIKSPGARWNVQMG